MPRFIGNPMGIASWIGELKSVHTGIRLKPFEGRSLCEFLDQRLLAGESNVDGPPCMVLAVSGCSVCAQDLLDRLSGGKLRSDDLRLAGDAPETRDRDQRDSCPEGGVPHLRPGRGRGRRKL